MIVPDSWVISFTSAIVQKTSVACHALIQKLDSGVLVTACSMPGSKGVMYLHHLSAPGCAEDLCTLKFRSTYACTLLALGSTSKAHGVVYIPTVAMLSEITCSGNPDMLSVSMQARDLGFHRLLVWLGRFSYEANKDCAVPVLPLEIL